jgi:hypothetical protein
MGGHSTGHFKQKSVYVRVLFQTVSEIELFHCTVPKLSIRKRYYVPFLIPMFIVQVTKLVQFTYIFENFTVTISVLCNSCEDMACCSSVQYTVQWNSSVLEIIQNRTCAYTFLLRMANTMTSQNIDISSWGMDGHTLSLSLSLIYI